MKQEVEKQNDHFILHSSTFNIRKECGFTLLEILVSLALLSVVLTAVYHTFFLAQRAIDGMDESVVKLQEARKALDILTCELDSVFFEGSDKSTFLRIKDRDSYGRTATEVTFTTFSALRPGLSEISYTVEERDGRLFLFKSIDPLIPTEKKKEKIDLIENLEAFSVEARYNDRWVRTWDTDVAGDTPGEIRVSVSFRLRDRVVTLTDIAMPKIHKTL